MPRSPKSVSKKKVDLVIGHVSDVSAALSTDGKREERAWPPYADVLRTVSDTNRSYGDESNAPDLPAVDALWCMEAALRHFPIEQTAKRLIEESPHAKERGSQYAIKTASDAAKSAKKLRAFEKSIAPLIPRSRLLKHPSAVAEPGEGVVSITGQTTASIYSSLFAAASEDASSEPSDPPTRSALGLQPKARITIVPGTVNAHNPPLSRSGLGEMASDKRIITVNGNSYVPVALAAWMGQTTPATIRRWIELDKLFEGSLLETHISTGKELYVSLQSVERIANRFVIWPSGMKTEGVIIGLCDDGTGFIPLQEAADTLGVAKQTLWGWANNGETPSKRPLDVVKCSTSDQLYLRQSNVNDLKSEIGHGLKRGPKHRALPAPPPPTARRKHPLSLNS